MERSWNVLFDCSSIDMWHPCEACAAKQYQGCDESACQCLDNPGDAQERRHPSRQTLSRMNRLNRNQHKN